MGKKQRFEQPIEAIPEIKEKQAFKLLVSLPATKSSHLQFQPQILDAIKKMCEGYEYDLDVGEANELGWQHVVDQFNRIANKVVNEGYDYVLIVESDVVPPPETLRKLLEDDVDVASAVVKYHRYSNKALDMLYKDIVCVGNFLDENKVCPVSNAYRSDIEGMKWTFKTHPLMQAGTGCMLIKRRVFEGGIRFICNYNYASYDVYFWRDIRKAGFNAVVDGNIFCEHLGE